MKPVLHISSKHNPYFKKLRQIQFDRDGLRVHARVLLEGEHLLETALSKGLYLETLVIEAGSAYGQQWIEAWGAQIGQIVALDPALMSTLSQLPSPPAVAGVMQLPLAPHIREYVPTVALDGVQDPGNAGSILRTAAALGYKQVITVKGTVALWSSKVLRAGMGAHWSLNIVESLTLNDIKTYPSFHWLLTSSHQGDWLHQLQHAAALPVTCHWVFGHEGQGVSADWQLMPHQLVRIAQPGGEESLNVAAAAAICLYASSAVHLDKNGVVPFA